MVRQIDGVSLNALGVDEPARHRVAWDNYMRVRSLNMQTTKFYNEYVGKKIREWRTAKNMSQTKLADVLGIAYQQIQKYEKGKSQIPIGRIIQIAITLNISPLDFLPKQKTRTHNPNAHLLSDKHTREIAQLFHELKDERVKQTILVMAKKFQENNYQEPYTLN